MLFINTILNKERIPRLLIAADAAAAAAAAKLLQLYLTLCDPIAGSPPGSPVPGILQARVLEWGALALVFKVLCFQIPCSSP